MFAWHDGWCVTLRVWRCWHQLVLNLMTAICCTIITDSQHIVITSHEYHNPYEHVCHIRPFSQCGGLWWEKDNYVNYPDYVSRLNVLSLNVVNMLYVKVICVFRNSGRVAFICACPLSLPLPFDWRTASSYWHVARWPAVCWQSSTTWQSKYRVAYGFQGLHQATPFRSSPYTWFELSVEPIAFWRIWRAALLECTSNGSCSQKTDSLDVCATLGNAWY